jgi:hypothetical protein
MRYSVTTGCFYPEDIDYPILPDDIVEVSQQGYEAALSRRLGETISVVDGQIVINPPLPPSAEQISLKKAAEVRFRRDQILIKTDYLVTRHRDQVSLGLATSLSEDSYLVLLTYRQALRDVTQQVGFPDSADMPSEPPFILEQ